MDVEIINQEFLFWLCSIKLCIWHNSLFSNRPFSGYIVFNGTTHARKKVWLSFWVFFYKLRWYGFYTQFEYVYLLQIIYFTYLPTYIYCSDQCKSQKHKKNFIVLLFLRSMANNQGLWRKNNVEIKFLFSLRTFL